MKKIETYNELLEKIKNEEKFLLYIKSRRRSICEVDFPKVKEIVDKNNYVSYYIQADKMSEAVGQLNLYSAPIVILFYNGKEIHRQY
ncbi:thioredoxin [Fusobacterium simiae]|uniref:thioredoxin n=1 Tax=Fusobacterium TaxID=848 RepID=UPI001899B450|nr:MULTISPECIES: thioredoxin [Fusobacterium]MDC7956357.1 thioredoxin [Fusobacterium simiae]